MVVDVSVCVFVTTANRGASEKNFFLAFPLTFFSINLFVSFRAEVLRMKREERRRLRKQEIQERKAQKRADREEFREGRTQGRCVTSDADKNRSTVSII